MIFLTRTDAIKAKFLVQSGASWGSEPIAGIYTINYISPHGLLWTVEVNSVTLVNRYASRGGAVVGGAIGGIIAGPGGAATGAATGASAASATIGQSEVTYKFQVIPPQPMNAEKIADKLIIDGKVDSTNWALALQLAKQVIIGSNNNAGTAQTRAASAAPVYGSDFGAWQRRQIAISEGSARAQTAAQTANIQSGPTMNTGIMPENSSSGVMKLLGTVVAGWAVNSLLG